MLQFVLLTDMRHFRALHAENVYAKGVVFKGQHRDPFGPYSICFDLLCNVTTSCTTSQQIDVVEVGPKEQVLCEDGTY